MVIIKNRQALWDGGDDEMIVLMFVAGPSERVWALATSIKVFFFFCVLSHIYILLFK